MLHCAITDLLAQGLDKPAAREARLREQVRGWAVDGVDIVQLREKQLESGEVFRLAVAAMAELRRGEGKPVRHGNPARPRLLVNGCADLAAAAGADGVHLTSGVGELRPGQVRQVFAGSGLPGCLVSMSCHTVDEVRAGAAGGADLLLFGPVFEKRIAGAPVREGVGLATLRAAVLAAGGVPVLALGGVTRETAHACRAAGAAGVAAIRWFAGDGRLRST